MAATWTREEDKLFETALARFDDEEDPLRWVHIAAQVPGKSPEQIRAHYEDLVHDVMLIESGRVELPAYPDDVSSASWADTGSGGSVMKRAELERKRGKPWTEEEHRLFLLGLEKYGKGDWRSISRCSVISRTATQVASHAQKYFLRQQNSGKKERKRTSIHDITIPPSDTTHLQPQPPIPPQPQLVPQGPFDPNQGGPQGPYAPSQLQGGPHCQVPFDHTQLQGGPQGQGQDQAPYDPSQGGFFGYPNYGFGFQPHFE